jgi:two-component system sensor histidine kinase KdpD
VSTPRATPEDFLELLERGKRGRLKLYLGFAAGVGKTYRMLEEAHRLRARGVDVVGALVETHGRAETEALVRDLELVPLRAIEYRGVVVKELDLAGVLARQPAIAIVDEIPHTNAPGSKNRKRYQDVLELLEAGIHVIGAMNVQHLESLNDLIERVTGVRVRETVPDTFLERTDQVVNLDLSVEDLLDRLRGGRIYAAEKVPWALEHFFKDGNLTTLRELALREVAQSLERSAAGQGKAALEAKDGGELRSRSNGRLMVALSSSPPRGAALLRRASRMAGRLATDWFAVYVETPREAPDRIDAEIQRHLLEHLELARQLGAEVVRLQAGDPAEALLDFARSHRVSDLVMGRSRQSWWRRVLGRSVSQRMLDEAIDLDVHVVGLDVEGRS